jgi:hypothetical protein
MDAVKQQFINLADAQFIIRCARVTSKSTAACPIFDQDANPFLVTDQSTKIGDKRKHTDGAPNILWCINWQRFELYFRDEIVLEMIANIGDQVLFLCLIVDRFAFRNVFQLFEHF